MEVWIKRDLAWINELDLAGEKNVMVNAANERISPGGGIDGALHDSVKAMNTTSPPADWQPVFLPTGGAATVLQAGAYAISGADYECKNIKFKIYHAVGPRASGTVDLAAAQGKVKTLYYDMLAKAHGDGVKRIVLPAISTVIFAGAGPGFTKAQFIVAMYEGIQKFVTEQAAHDMVIVLNNWQPAL